MAKKRKPASAKQFLGQAAILMLFLVGLLIAFYPLYVNTLNDFLDQRRIEQVKQQDASQAAKLAEMREENKKLAQTGGSPGADPFSDKSTGKQDANYFEEHLIGSVTLPKLDIEVQLFDTTNEFLLDSGATVLQGTSFPTGGTDTHTVISAHSGLPNRELFTHLNQLTIGDQFILTVYGEKFAYEVFEINTVKPDETELLRIRPGEDLATLLTCTPYMINSHRLLVTGKRVPYTEEVKAAAQTAVKKQTQKNLLIMGGTLVVVLGLLYLIYRAIKRYVLWRRRGDLVFWRLTDTKMPEGSAPNSLDDKESGPRILRDSPDGNLEKKDRSAMVPVIGAQYALYNRWGRKPIQRNGQPLTAISDHEGKVVFADLPGGMFVLKELAPDVQVSVSVGIKKWRQAHLRFFSKKNQKMIFQNEPKMIIKKG